MGRFVSDKDQCGNPTEQPLVPWHLLARQSTDESLSSHMKHLGPDLPEHAKHRCAYKLVENGAFGVISVVVIVLNAIELGIACEYSYPPWVDVWYVFDHMFTAFFVVEAIVMISLYRTVYFKDPWMLFDFVIAVASVVDTWIAPFVDLGQTEFIRTFRLIRLLRVIRVTSVVPDLSALVKGLLNSVGGLFWICVLSGVILYMFSVCTVQILGKPDSGYPAYNESDQAISEA